jgi:hypothetical protein
MKQRLTLLLTLLLLTALPALAQSFPRQVRVSAATANLRQGAGTNQPIVGSIERGTILETLSQSGVWYHVRLPAELGLRAAEAFVHGSLVEPVRMAEPLTNGAPSAPSPAASTASGPPPRSVPQSAPGYKNPTAAMLISVLLPGAGHFYTGETKRGALLLGVGVGGLVVGTAMSVSSVGLSCDDDFSCEDDTNYLPLIVGYGAYLGSWLYGIVDADASAQRMNTRRGFAFGGTQVQPLAAVDGEGAASLGFRVTF